MNHPTDPTDHDTPWEEAMSRDFDARVRDLHEAPFDFTAVQGKARRIKRNRRAAVAGSVLGVAAIVTPIAVLSNGGTTQTKQPDFANPSDGGSTSTVAPDTPALPDYLQGNVWHQADGDTVELSETDQPYTSSVLWGDLLVAIRWDGEVFNVADVIDDSGAVVDSFEVTSSVVVNDAGTTIAWIDPDTNEVRAAWDDQDATINAVDLASPGEGVAWDVAAIAGGPDCNEAADGCTVYLNNGLGENPTAVGSDGTDENPVPGALDYRDATTVGGSKVLFVDSYNPDTSLCTGLYDLEASAATWTTCDFDAREVSPDGSLVSALPSQYDGIGTAWIAILDADSGEETGRFAPEGGFVSSGAVWTPDNRLVFSAYDGARWHLYSMDVTGETTELGDPVEGPAESTPFRLVRR
ncbi:hypothetical protein [Nocardioides stalactiti]|uniref:hypothetical protein n=1 Tax=Nocardioides stalactiti TaxID=2755356 RepID=UPI001602843F|nr:hypothetical protein [Nocardioides stalactiti]